jgi:hypothetical protein
LFTRKRADAPPDQQRLESLTTELGSLTEEERGGVARGLAMLWDAFVGRFGGLDGFLSVDQQQRDGYVSELRSAVDRMSKVPALTASRYSLSPAVMLLYLERIASQDRSETARRFGNATAQLIERGRQLRSRPMS